MSDAATTADLPPPSRSGRLLSLVRKLWDYGRDLSRSLRQRHPNEPMALRHSFGTADIVLILTRIAVGMRRASMLEEKITRSASQIDAGTLPEPPPRAPRAADTQPRAPKSTWPSEPPPTDTLSLIVRLPTADKIARKMRHQSIGDVLADICRDMGIARGHPLWDELHAAITEFGGNFARLVVDRLNQLFPIAHLVERLKAGPEGPPEPGSTGPPPAPA